MKICVIGNSHVGMMVHAARAGAAEGLDLTYIARQGRGPEGIRLRGAFLRVMRPESQRALAKLDMPDRVRIADFDAFVIVAMTATVFSILPLISEHTVYTWPSMRATLKSATQDETVLLERPFLSETAIEASLIHGIQQNITFSVVQKLRRAGDVPIVLVSQPGPSERALRADSRQIGLKRLARGSDTAAARACLLGAHDAVFGDFEGVTQVAQPEETRHMDCFTKEEFTRGAGRLTPDGNQPEDDILHANARYGALVFDQIRAELDR